MRICRSWSAVVTVVGVLLPAVAGAQAPPPIGLEPILEFLDSRDNNAESEALRRIYTLGQMEIPAVPTQEAIAETALATLTSEFPNAGECVNSNVGADQAWDLLIQLYEAAQSIDERYALQILQNNPETLAIVSRGWNGASGTLALCARGTFQVIFSDGRVLSIDVDYSETTDGAAFRVAAP